MLSLLVGIGIGAAGSSSQVSQLTKERDVAVTAQGRAEGAIGSEVDARAVGATKARQLALDTREKAQNDRQTALDGREQALNGRQTALDGRQSALDGREATVKDLESAVSGRESAVSGQEATAQANTVSGDGTYLVGKDIQPGTYRAAAAPSGSCYWEREKGTGGGIGDIIANDNASGPVVITVRPSEAALRLSGCSDFHKVS